jgi:type IV pilus assembly protein PilQ
VVSRPSPCWGSLLLLGLLASTAVDAPPVFSQAEIRQDGVQLKIRRLPDSIELVIEDAGIGGALEQKRDGTNWLGELRTDRIRGLKSGPQSLAMPDAGMQSITFDGSGRLFQLKVVPVQGKTVPAPVLSSDGKNLVVRFDAPRLPITQTARPNISRPVPVPTPAFVPPLQPRAAAPPVGDMAVGSMVVRNRAYVNLSGPPVTMTTRGANARDVLMVLAQMGGYGFAYSDPVMSQANGGGSNPATNPGAPTTQPASNPVTVAFRAEPYERAFNFVLLTSGLQARREGNTVLVGPNILSKNLGSQLSKVYRLNQIGPDQAADYLANLGAQVTKTNTSTISSSQGVSQKDAVQNANTSQTTKTTTTTSVEAYGASTGPLLGLSATTDTRLGTITLFGESPLIAIAEQYLRQLDLRQRQVALSVKILDVNLSNDSDIDNSFALRFGTNFIVNDGGQLLAAFGQNLPARSGDFEGQVGPSIDRTSSSANRTTGQSVSTASESSSSDAASGGQTQTVNQRLVFNVKGGRSLSQEQTEQLNIELTKATGTEAVVLEPGQRFEVVTLTSSGRRLTDSLTRNIKETIESSIGQEVEISRVNTTSSSNTWEVLKRVSAASEAGRTSDAQSASSYQAATRRNPGGNYNDNQFYDFLRAQIVSSNTKILASPTLILQEGGADYGGSDAARISNDGKVGRSRTNEAFVRVGTQFVTSYNVKQDINGNNFCEPIFGNAGLTFGARVDKIDDNGFVTFSLSPEISAAVGTQSVGNCGPINIINDRLLDTGKLRVRDGQTLILTGVISSTDQQVVSKWPILGDMPLVGQFFRRTSGSRTKNELVIMVTPRVIDDDRGGVYGYGYEPSTLDTKGLLYRSGNL